MLMSESYSKFSDLIFSRITVPMEEVSGMRCAVALRLRGHDIGTLHFQSLHHRLHSGLMISSTTEQLAIRYMCKIKAYFYPLSDNLKVLNEAAFHPKAFSHPILAAGECFQKAACQWYIIHLHCIHYPVSYKSCRPMLWILGNGNTPVNLFNPLSESERRHSLL